MQIKWVGANPKNFAIGRQNEKITKICLHWVVGKLSAADAVFNNPDRQVSAHYGIGHTTIHQYVREEDTAYHAGNLTVNRQSIGIEHEGGPDLPISEDTHKTSIELVTDICRRYNIPADRQHILKHSEIKATQCPGTLDIDRIIREVQIRLDKFTQDNVKILTDQIEKLQGQISQTQKALSEVEAERDTFREERDKTLSNVCPDPSVHSGSNSGDPTGSDTSTIILDTDDSSVSSDTPTGDKENFIQKLINALIKFFREMLK